jgi:hypothetical protein
MAFIKLWPPENHPWLPISEIIRRLEDEFAFVHADPDAGQDHVASMIAAVHRFSDDMPGKQERLDTFRSLQESAVVVTFADDQLGPAAFCCLLRDSELFFDSPDAIDGPALSSSVRLWR